MTKKLGDVAVLLALTGAVLAVNLISEPDSPPLAREPTQSDLSLPLQEGRVITDVAPQPLGISAKSPHCDEMGDLLKTVRDGFLLKSVDLKEFEISNRGADFDVLLLTCADPGSVSPSLPLRLRDFVERGGTLYASDFLFQVVMQAFPEFVDETKVARGTAQSLTARVTHEGLQDIVGDEIALHFDEDGWRPAAFHSDSVTVQIEGTLQTTTGINLTAPLLVTFPVEQGTVVFSSFHKQHHNSQEEVQLLSYLASTIVAEALDSKVKQKMGGSSSPEEDSLLSALPELDARHQGPKVEPRASAFELHEREVLEDKQSKRRSDHHPDVPAFKAALAGVELPAATFKTTEPAVEQYRTNTIDPRAQNLPSDLEGNIRTDPGQYLDALVSHLVDGVEDPFERAKILHDWVAENIAYDVELFFDGDASAVATWESTLRNGKSICAGYAALYRKMCESASIRCVEVSGYARGYHYDERDDEDLSQSNHLWNAVHLNDSWYLVDVTWDAGYVGEDQKFHKSFSHAYLFLEPEHFLYTHLPTDPKWQLLSQPKTRDDFATLPYLEGSFFENGLRMTGHFPRRTRVRSSASFMFRVPSDVVILCGVETVAGVECENRALVQRDEGHCRVIATFPNPGQWKLQLFAKKRASQGGYSRVATFEIEAREGTSSLFPNTYSSYREFDASLISPLFMPLKTGVAQVFKIRITGYDVYLLVGENPWQRLEPHPTEPNVYQLTARISENERVALIARARSGDPRFATLVEYSNDVNRQLAEANAK